MKRILRQRRVRLGAAGAAACALLGLAALTAGPARAVTAGTATVTVNLAGKTTGSISNHFIGLSFESGTLNNGFRYDDVGNLTQLLQNLGQGIMRFGGNSADLSSFTGISQDSADAVTRLAQATGWQVIYTENLLNSKPALVTADAQLVGSTLGSSLYAFACGNEPDMYVPTKVRPASYTVTSYLTEVNACYKAIHAGDKTAPIDGPDVAWQPTWLSTFAEKEGSAIKALGAHYYPLGCGSTGTSTSQAASNLMSADLASKEVSRLQGYMAIAKKYAKPLRVTETNSACNGGEKGVSNAYASALWVIDYMLSGAQLGISGMNFHGGLNTLCGGYTVLCSVGQNTYSPQPIYYGLLFTALFGTGGFLPVTVATSSSDQHVVAFADKPSAGPVHVMVENLGAQTASSTFSLAGYKGTAVSVLRLTGGSPLATSGILIQGSSVANDGTFTPRPATSVACKSGTVSLALAPYSAALLTLS